MHVRRGDINEKDWPSRWINDDTELRCAEYVLREIAANSHSDCSQLHIVSEGKVIDFSSTFGHLDPIYHLTEDALVTFHHMVKADVLILWHRVPSQARRIT